MLRLLFAPPYSDLCGEVIRRNAERERSFLIVPRHYSHECERRLCEVLGDTASARMEVLSVDRLYARVASEVGGASERFLDDAGRLLVAYSAAQRVSSQMRVFAGELRRTEFLTEALRIIDELQSCRVEPEALGRASELANGDLGDRLHDLALIAESYSAELAVRGARRDRISALIDLLDCGWAEGKTFAFFGYTEFTEQETELLRKLLRTSEVTVALGCDRSLINPALGEDDPLYAYARTAGRLTRLAESEGVKVEVERFVEPRDSRPPELKFITNEFIAEAGLKFDGSPDAVILAEERSTWSECERAAAYILDAVRAKGWRFRDFAVALPAGDEYLSALEAVFGSWGIPIFMDSVDSALGTPVLSAFTSALDILRNGFASEDVLRYLKSGLSPLSFEGCCEVENYAYVWNISGGKWLSDWIGSPRGFSATLDDADIRTLDRLNRRRKQLVEPFERFRATIRPGESRKAGDILHAFYDLLIELRLDRRIAAAARQYAEAGELKTAGEYSQLWGKVCDLMDEFFELAGDETMKFDEFAQLFELLLGGVSVGTIPPALDGVPVGEVGRLRHRTPKALLILDARAGVFPPVSASVGLLDDRDREELAELDIGLEPSTRHLRWRSLDTAYSALGLPTESLYISWSPSTEGGTPTPSPLVLRLRDELGASVQPPSDFHRLLAAESPALEFAMRAVGGSADRAANAALEYFSESEEKSELLDRAKKVAEGGRGELARESAEALYGDTIHLTASRSDKFMDCAFGYFCQYGLRAHVRKRAELDNMENGTLIHAVLENTVRRASEDGLLSGEITEREKSAATEIAHGELASYITSRLGPAAVDDPRTRRLFDRAERAIDRIVASIMDEFAASSFRPIGFEVGFGIQDAPLDPVPIGENGEMSGVIDRVDSWHDEAENRQYFRVIDYKSGNKQFNYTDIYHGVSLQLPIYLHVLRRFAEENGIAASEAGAFYSPAADTVARGDRGDSDAEIKAALEKKERRSGVYLGDDAVIDAMEHGGAARFLPSEARYKLDRAQFAMLERHVERETAEAVKRISGGEIEAHPSTHSNDRSACDYCDFRAACRFDPSGGRDRENLRYKVDGKMFWDKLAGEEGENDA